MTNIYNRKIGRDIKITSTIFVLIVSLVLPLMNLREGYRTPDELRYTREWAHNDFSSTSDIRVITNYFIWAFYISHLVNINAALPIVINTVLLIILTIGIFRKTGNIFFLTLLIFPSIFLFANSYLRDFIFLLLSLLILLSENDKSILFAILLSLFIRPFYAFIFLAAYIITFLFKRKGPKWILLYSSISVFLLSSLVLASSSYFNLYHSVLLIHGANQEKLGVLGIGFDDFAPLTASLNILLAFPAFWAAVDFSIGKTFGFLILIENVFIVFCILRLLKVFARKQLSPKEFFSLSMLALSEIMALLTQSTTDSLRFRLIFIPFLIYLQHSDYRFNRYRMVNPSR